MRRTRQRKERHGFEKLNPSSDCHIVSNRHRVQAVSDVGVTRAGPVDAVVVVAAVSGQSPGEVRADTACDLGIRASPYRPPCIRHYPGSFI
jgi:acyl CoA:acetate/3-ketoacid CoA transferase beta subunit